MRMRYGVVFSNEKQRRPSYERWHLQSSSENPFPNGWLQCSNDFSTSCPAIAPPLAATFSLLGSQKSVSRLRYKLLLSWLCVALHLSALLYGDWSAPAPIREIGSESTTFCQNKSLPYFLMKAIALVSFSTDMQISR